MSMYSCFFSSNNRYSSSRYTYTGYGYGSGNRSSRRRFGFARSIVTSYDDNTYFYGRSRRRPHYWERERERRDNLNRNRNNRRNRRRSPSPETPPSRPPKPVIPKEELAKELHCKDVDLHIEANTKKHRTDDYDCTKKRKVNGKIEEAELVVRRGDSIKMTLTFDRPYSKEKNDLKLCFSLGENPLPSKGTKNVFEIDESGKKSFKSHEWGATLVDKKGNDATLLISIPANCIVGEWNFYVVTVSEGKDRQGNPQKVTKNFEIEDDVIILFNPWCKDDECYMKDEAALDEYILNDIGGVWRGNAYQYSPKHWNFGQFEEGILDAALQLIRLGFNSKLRPMSDPVKVSRMVAKMVNASDDNGILVGNWSGDYSDGKSPTSWVGSVKIIQQWQKSGPVKYGQCWVFSCVTTTICRALGLPCRTVTNFSSAHDSDQSNCIEKYFMKQNGADEPINYDGSSDSVWNFHVWNEVWMVRNDLFDFTDPGWQVIDATPQETSEGVYTCGPCPVTAIRKGMCRTNYDCGFIFSEVNADEIHWRVLPDGSLERLKFDKKKIGKSISTKKPDGGGVSYGNSDRLDLTLDYKPPEGSAEERETVMNAHNTAFKRKPIAYAEKENEEAVKFHLTHNDNCMIGGKMVIEVKAKNECNVERDLRYVVIFVAPTSYTGARGDTFFKKYFGKSSLKPGEEKVFQTVLDPEDYLDKLVEQASVSIVAVGKVARKGNQYTAEKMKKEHQVRFRRPDIKVECPKEAHVGENVKFVISFDNPLEKALTCCSVSMESVGFTDFDDAPEVDVPPKATYRREFTMPAVKAKKNAAVNFSFECKEIPDISGTATIRIVQ